MKNLEVRRKIDGKIKLQKRNIAISCVALPVAAICVGVGVKGIADTLLDPNLSQYFNAGAITAVHFLLGSHLLISNINHLNFLKELREELQGGINRFENIEEADFEEAFQKCIEYTSIKK